MANQYSGSIEHKARQKYNCSAESLLERFAKEKLSYFDVQDRLGVTHGTIRKWARRFGIELSPGQMTQDKKDYAELFYGREINALNFLSRSWSTEEELGAAQQSLDAMQQSVSAEQSSDAVSVA